MEIGFVGLGTMRRGIIRNLLRTGRHVTGAPNLSNVAQAVYEAGSKYLGWEMSRRSCA